MSYISSTFSDQVFVPYDEVHQRPSSLEDTRKHREIECRVFSGILWIEILLDDWSLHALFSKREHNISKKKVFPAWLVY